MRVRTIVAGVAVLLSSCAPRTPQTYRLVPQPQSGTLVPPGVANPQAAMGKLSIPAATPAGCDTPEKAITSTRHGRTLRLSVSREQLLKQSPGWLLEWTAELEHRGCIPAGSGADLAMQVLQSVPMDPSEAYRLLHADNVRAGYVELGPENRLQTQAPILKAGSAPDADTLEISSVRGHGATVEVDVRSSDTLLGVETSWYALRPKARGPGSTIIALSSERRIDGKTEPAPGPARNYFGFAPDIAFYRLIYKSDLQEKGATTEIVVGAPDRVELERRTHLVLDNPDTCKSSDPSLCAVIPRHVALNAVLAVTVNGQEVRVGIHAPLRAAIRQSGGPQRPEDVLPTLTVQKLYHGKLTGVEFDRTSSAILDMTLLGGEEISWK